MSHTLRAYGGLTFAQHGLDYMRNMMFWGREAGEIIRIMEPDRKSKYACFVDLFTIMSYSGCRLAPIL